MANAQDHKYRRLRRILRARFSRWLGRRLPPSWIWAIGQSLAENYTGDEIARRMPLKKIFDEYAARKLAEGYDAVILGHLHIPAFTEAPGARAYVNLGDWLQWRTFLRWEDGRLSLRRWAWPEAVEQPAEIP
jgi:UDP-2,3-diacylglucosamine hydrolase